MTFRLEIPPLFKPKLHPRIVREALRVDMRLARGDRAAAEGRALEALVVTLNEAADAPETGPYVLAAFARCLEQHEEGKLTGTVALMVLADIVGMRADDECTHALVARAVRVAREFGLEVTEV